MISLKEFGIFPLTSAKNCGKMNGRAMMHEPPGHILVNPEIEGFSCKEVIQLAEQAKSQGWAGDWDKRIEKAKKKLGK